MYDLICTDCGAPFQAQRPDKLYCSPRCIGRAGRRRRGEQSDITAAGRDCGVCGAHFEIPQPNSNQRYCSSVCSTAAAKEQRRAYHKRKPHIQKVYNSRRPYKDVRIERLRRKYPDLPSACEACGEARVLEIAHRPGYERNGAWRLMSNCQRHMVWILCPTCHKLLDRGISSPGALGLAV
jgi:hypothetical protein